MTFRYCGSSDVSRGSVVIRMLWLIALVGCGGPATCPVTGKVVLKGQADPKALVGYMVTFESTEQPVSAIGEVQADGTFTMTTYEDGDGVVPGKQRVAITTPVLASDLPRPKSLIDARYGEFKTSGLEVVITPGKNDVQWELDPATTQ